VIVPTASGDYVVLQNLSAGDDAIKGLLVRSIARTAGIHRSFVERNDIKARRLARARGTSRTLHGSVQTKWKLAKEESDLR